MSFFIGASESSTPILHITNEQEAELQMKSDEPIGSSVFHSSMQYIQLKKWSGFVEEVRATYHSPSDGGSTVPINIMRLSSEFITHISSKPFILLFFKGKLVTTSGIKQLPSVPLSTLIGYEYGTSNFSDYPTATYNWVCINVGFRGIMYDRTYVTPTELSTIVPSDFTCYTLNLNETSFFTTTDTSGIHVSREELLVRGVDIANTPYLSNARVNPSDTQLVTEVWGPNGKISDNPLSLFIVDPTTMVGSLSVSKDYIKKGTEYIINTNTSSTNIFFKDVYHSVIGDLGGILIQMNKVYPVLPQHQFVPGEFFVISKMRYSVASGESFDSLQQSLFSYNEGYISTVFSVFDRDALFVRVYYNLIGINGILNIIALPQPRADSADFGLSVSIMTFG